VRVTFDTNVLIYSWDVDAGRRHSLAVDLINRSLSRDCVLTLQSLGEAFRALTGRFKLSAAFASARVERWRRTFPIVAADEPCLIEAMNAVAEHGFSFWDAMIWATARRAGCRLLISEDLQDGRTLGGVTIVNPFAATPSPLIEQALGPAG
jgi:predicted nucleic acid-binding protein